MTDKELLDLALEALRSAAAELYKASSYCNTYEVLGNTNDAITAIQKARAAQPAPVQEPVGYVAENGVVDWNVCAPPILTDLYTTPPAAQRQWVGLTNDEINEFAAGCHLGNSVQGAIFKAQAKLKEKNT
jgi:hypothetical protein